MNGYQSPSVFRKQKETPKSHPTLGGSDHTNYTKVTQTSHHKRRERHRAWTVRWCPWKYWQETLPTLQWLRLRSWWMLGKWQSWRTLQSVGSVCVSFPYAIAFHEVHEGGKAQDNALRHEELMDCSIRHMSSGSHIFDGFPMAFEFALLVFANFRLWWIPRLRSFADIVGGFGCC